MLNSIEKLGFPWNIVIYILYAAFVIAVIWAALRLNRYAFKKLRERQNGIHLAFFEKTNSLVIVVGIIVLAVSAFIGIRSVWQTMLGGTAIFSAVIAFAAQDTIKDILAGLVISVHKPFEINDRILLDNGTAGIVECITMRHVVLRGIDDIKYVIPNSRINAQQLTNFSSSDGLRSARFEFHVGYGSDMDKVKSIVSETVGNCAYTSPGVLRDGELCYSPSYFTRFDKSSLVVEVVAFFEPRYPTEVVIDEINSSVRRALIENGIEIPYEYINVVSNDKD